MSATVTQQLLVLVSALAFVGDVIASAHAILFKRDPRATALWVIIIWGIPVAGCVLYATLGINRIRRRAQRLRSRDGRPAAAAAAPVAAAAFPPAVAHLAALVPTIDRIVPQRLLAGNRIDVLEDGDQGYPAMLAAIDGARSSIALSTYIFDLDEVGERFAAALAAAAARGVQVRVLIDAAGARYSPRPMPRHLHRLGVTVARFLPTRVPWRLPYANLRNHRKILVVDGAIGFTGGLNVRAACLVARHGARATRDLHFRLQGPVVGALQEAFADDWEFTTGERLAGATWFPPLDAVGTVPARCITDGPDEDFERARWTLMAALGAARHRVRVVTPYFLPDGGLLTALGLAALRGVAIEIHLPERGNLRFVQWASTAQLWQVLVRGCRVFLTPPPFDHSKLLVVDDAWVLFGSSNWDPRSLRLNFELDVECHDSTLAATVAAIVARRAAGGRELTLAAVDARPLWMRLRDGLARLFQPHL